MSTTTPDMQLTAAQSLAVSTCLSSPRAIITGGAGSGKSTVVKTIVDKLFYGNHGETILCCPTGKAAQRIREVTGQKAYTVHAAFGLFPQEGTDEIGNTASFPPALSAKNIVIDEAGMLPDDLLAAAVRKIPQDTRVILVGDQFQLAPVGAGYPFRDLIASKKVPHVHLDVCHRQDGKLLENCYAILRGDSSSLIYDAGRGNRRDADWGFIPCGDDSIKPALAKLFTDDAGGVEDTFGIHAESLLVLTPLNKGDAGRIQLNREIQQAYHTSRGRLSPTYKTNEERDQYVVGDRVIWTKNDKINQLVNGDIGRVLAVGKDKVVVDFDGIGEKTVEQGQTLQLAWVMTCHKAQGSQYEKVLVVQSGKHTGEYLEGVVNRSWIYTAATRSKKATFLLGSERAFKKHVDTEAVDRRNTYLSMLVA